MWMTLDEVAKYLRVSKDTIYKMAQAKEIPSAKVGSQWRFSKELVDEWMLGTSESPQVVSSESIEQGGED
jgi:excisionase family DNA binding protein